MYIVRLICSDEYCADEVMAEAQTLEELDLLVCDCDCTLTLIGFPDHVDEPLADVLVVAFGRPRSRDLAA